MSLIRVILINPYDQTITEQKMEACKGNLDPLYKLISHPATDEYPEHKVDLVERVTWLQVKATLWLDEEGLLGEVPHWHWRGIGQPFAGKGVLSTSGASGDLPSNITIDIIKPYIRW